MSYGHIVAKGHHEGFDMAGRKPMQVRLPDDVKAWLASQSEANQSSQNSEIIRALRERMDRTEAT